MKKKIIKIVMGIMMIGMLSACGKEEEPAISSPETVSEEYQPVQEEAAEEKAENTSSESDFVCQEIEGVMTLTEYTGSAAVVNVPENIGGKTITAIGDRAFSQNETLEEVILPDSVTVIGEGAFSMCGALVKATLGANTEVIKKEAFYMSFELAEVNLPDSILEIGEAAFSGPTLLAVIIPSKIQTLEMHVFAGIENEKIVIPGNVKEVGERAFEMCEYLKEVTIDEGVEYIGTNSFNDCKKLVKASIPQSVTYIDEYAFEKVEGFTIVTPAGSYAEQFAKEQGIPCVNE